MSHVFSHRDSRLMDEALNQRGPSICWAISLTRQATAILRSHHVIGDNERLSIQYLINAVGSGLSQAIRSTWDGGVCSLERASEYLREGGSVLKTDCAFTRRLLDTNPSFIGKRRFIFQTKIHRRKDYTYEEFEEELVRCLRHSPVSASVFNFGSLGSVIRNEVFVPTKADRRARDRDPTPQHTMLLYGWTRHEWLFQDSYGTSRRTDAGNLKVYKTEDMITEFVEMIYLREEGPNAPPMRQKKRKRQEYKSTSKRHDSKSTDKRHDSKTSKRGRRGGNTLPGRGARQYRACSEPPPPTSFLSQEGVSIEAVAKENKKVTGKIKKALNKTKTSFPKANMKDASIKDNAKETNKAVGKIKKSIAINKVKEEEIQIEARLPNGISLTNVSGIDVPTEETGNVLQFLEFWSAFGMALDLKEERRYSKRQQYCSVIPMMIQLMELISNDREMSLSLSATDSTWFSSLGECLLQSGVLSDVFLPETFKSGVSEYKKMDASTRLKLLNFLCDESLSTLYVFKGGKVTREPGAVKGGKTVIAFIEDPDGYKFELLERGPPPEPLCQVMLRVGDLDRSIKFYEKAFGMELLRMRDDPEYKYTIAMMGYGPEDKTAVLELTYNYGVTEYDKGNAYAQIAIGTDDVYKTAEAVKLFGGKITACLDPDGWKSVFVDNVDFLKELE